MVLVIDNYDSFTYNLVQYLGELKVELQVHRNDQITVEQARALKPDRVLVSPGPCSPKESGLSNEIIRELGREVPLFGVCLGHQCIGYTFGAGSGEDRGGALQVILDVLASVLDGLQPAVWFFGHASAFCQ